MKDFMNQFNDDERRGARFQGGRRGGRHGQGFGAGRPGQGFGGGRPGQGFGPQDQPGFGAAGFEAQGAAGFEAQGVGGFGPGEGFGPRPGGRDERPGFGDRSFGDRSFGAGGFGGGFGAGRGQFGPEGPVFGDMGHGFGGPRGPRGGRGGRGPGRGRKGDVRNAILSLLGEEELNGYGLITRISEKSEGLWRPSAGSIYPALGLLEDEGLITPVEVDGKKVFRLTEQGKAWSAEHAEQLDKPWEKVAEPHKGFLDVRGDLHQLGMALQQVVVAGDQEQVEAARRILEKARKDLYRLLAGEAQPTGDDESRDGEATEA